MNNHTLKIITKSKKNILLIIELFFASISFVLIFSLITQAIKNTTYPLSFSYKDVYKFDIDYPDYIEDGRKYEKQYFNFLKSYPGIKNTGFWMFNEIFTQGHAYPDKYLVYHDIKIDGKDIHQFGATNEMGEILSIEMVDGRWFNVSDNALSQRPAIISRKLSKELFGNASPVGKSIQYCDGSLCKIIGVCADFKFRGEFSMPEKLFILRHHFEDNITYPGNLYCAISSYSGQAYYMKCETSLPPDFESKLIRESKQKFPDIKLTLTKLEKLHKSYIKRIWLPLILILSLILFLFINVLFGLFGVLWYNISLRKPEIGLRMAVGANKSNIYKQFIGEMLVLATLGILPGLIIAAQFPILKVFNIETNVYIIAMLAATLIIYLLVTLCALLPSAQAAKIQPAEALHEE